MNEWMNKWMGGWIDGWMDEVFCPRINVFWNY